MDTYSIEWKSSALKELKRLDRQAIPRILRAVEALGDDPFSGDVRKLKGSEHSYRLRVVDYRVVYNVFGTRLIVEIIRVRHRKDAYER